MDNLTAIVGQKGSGKSSVLQMVRALGFYATDLSTPLRIFELEGKKRTDLENNQWRASALDIVYQNCLVHARGPVFIDGISRPAELEYLERTGKLYFIVSISAPEEIRFPRVFERARKGEEKLTVERYREKCHRRLGSIKGYEANDLNALMAATDYHIENTGDLPTLLEKTKLMLRHFGHLQ